MIDGERVLSRGRTVLWAFVVVSATVIGAGTAAGTTHSTVPSTAGPADSEAIESDCGLSGDIESAAATGKVGDVRVEQPTRLGVRPPEQTAETFADVTKLLNLSDTPQDTVVGIVPPEDADRSGWASRGGDNVCLTGSQRTLWDGLMVHEYVHNRQEFSTASDMEWFVESSAFYYMAVVPYQRGTMSENRANKRLGEPRRRDNSSDIKEITLTASEVDTHALAERGKPVLAALDREIRNRTNGDRTLEHVIREMNEESGEITYYDFKRIVADVAGERMGGWLDRYVDGSAVVGRQQSQVKGLTLTSSAAKPSFRIHRIDTPGGEATAPFDDSVRMNITEGAAPRVSAVVDNDGTIEDRQSVRLLVDGPDAGQRTIDRANETIAAAGSTTVSFSTGSMGDLEPGSYRLLVATQDDVVGGALTVDAGEPQNESDGDRSQEQSGSRHDTAAEQPNQPSGPFGLPAIFYRSGAMILLLCLSLMFFKRLL